MAPPLILSLTHRRLHAHTRDLQPAPAPRAAPTALAASPTHVADGAESGALTLRDPLSLAAIHTLPSHSAPVTALAIAASHLAAGHADGSVALHDLATHAHASFKEASPVVSLAFPASARHLAAASASAIALFSTVSNRLITRLTQPQARSYPRIANAQARFTAVAFSPVHAPLLAATDDTGCVTVYDVASILSSSRTHPLNASTPTSSATHARFPSALRAPATALAFARDGHLAVAGFDKLVRVFQPSLKNLLLSVTLPAPVSAVAFSDVIAVGLTDASIALVRLNMDQASGTVIKRVSVDAGVGAAGSLAIKQILFQPLPKRRKPPRSATPLDLTADPSVDDFLSSIDQLVDGAAATRHAPQDADVFSPVKKRVPPSFERQGKSASFHAAHSTVGTKPYTAPRSRSVQELTPSKLRFDSAADNVPENSDARGHDWDALHENASASAGQREFGVEERRDQPLEQQGSTIIDDRVRFGRVDSSRSHSSLDRTDSSRSHTAGSSFTDAKSSSSRHLSETQILRGVSDVNVTPALPPRLPRGNASDVADRGVRFDYQKDVMLGHAVLESPIHAQASQENSLRSTQDLTPEEKEAKQRSLYDENETSPRIPVRTSTEDESPLISFDYRKPEPQRSGQSSLIEEVRDVVQQEMDVVRSDIRSDILNIHAEIIRLAVRQSQELATIVKDRDQTVTRLEAEVERLRADNLRLRRKYGLE